MRDRFCWHCGHVQGEHTYVGGCSFGGGGRCDCARYEDGEHFGQNLRRDLYTYSDARRLTLKTRVRHRAGPPVPPPGGRPPDGPPPPKPAPEPEEPREEPLSEELRMSRLEVHLAEYTALREEINRRLDAQRQAFNYTVAVLGAFVAGAGLLAGKDAVGPSVVALVPHMLLLLPLIIGPLAFIFFDDELVLYRNIYHICLHLREKVAQVTLEQRPNKPFMVEAEGFRRMWGLSRTMHPVLSSSRWILFVAPVAVPLLVYRLTEPHIRRGPIPVGEFRVDVYPYSEILFWVDVIIGIILAAAIFTVLLEQYTWKKRLGDDWSAAAFAARPSVRRPGK